MTDSELQRFAGARVRLTYGGQTFEGKLLDGFTAQLDVQAPYAIQWYADNAALGVKEERITPIASADAVEHIEYADKDEAADAEIEDDLDEERTPG
jgi:hypothetical protein